VQRAPLWSKGRNMKKTQKRAMMTREETHSHRKGLLEIKVVVGCECLLSCSDDSNKISKIVNEKLWSHKVFRKRGRAEMFPVKEDSEYLISRMVSLSLVILSTPLWWYQWSTPIPYSKHWYVSATIVMFLSEWIHLILKITNSMSRCDLTHVGLLLYLPKGNVYYIFELKSAL
jgi:hypothetical protein